MGLLKVMVIKLFKGVLAEVISEERDALIKETRSILRDITYRMDALKELSGDLPRKIQTTDLNLATPFIDGYVFTNNHNGTAAAPGYVAWTDVNIVYKGTKYTLTNGNTNLKYLYWTLATTPTTMKFSDTKPTLAADDILIGINNGGTFELTMGVGKLTPGAALTNGSISENELGNDAVTSLKIADSAITAGKIGSGAVTSAKIGSGAVGSTALADSAVTSAKLGSSAVVAGKIATGAVNNANLFTAGVVNGTAISDSAVTSAKIGSAAVTAGKIGTGAVNNSNLFASGVVNSTAISSGAVAEDKLNVATHFIF